MSRAEAKYEPDESKKIAAEKAIASYDWKKLKKLTVDPASNQFKTREGLSAIEINAYWKRMCESFFASKAPKSLDDKEENFYQQFIKQYSHTLDLIKADEFRFTDLPVSFQQDVAAAFLAETCNRYSVTESKHPIRHSPILWRMLINKDPSYIVHFAIPASLSKDPAMIRVKVDYAISSSNSDSIMSLYSTPIDKQRLKKITQGLLELKAANHHAHKYASLVSCELDKLFLSSLSTDKSGEPNPLGSFFRALPNSVQYLWVSSNGLGDIPECSKLIQEAFSYIPPHISHVQLSDNRLAENDGIVLESILLGLNQARGVDSLNLSYNNLHTLSQDRLADIFIKLPQSITRLTIYTRDGINATQLTEIIESIPLSVKHISMYFKEGTDMQVLFDKLRAQRAEKVCAYFKRLEAGEEPPRQARLYAGGGGGGGEGYGSLAPQEDAETKSDARVLSALSITASTPRTSSPPRPFSTPRTRLLAIEIAKAEASRRP
jgi:hypothetical protein